ncbi:MGMT family protein [Paenibacillus gansuensis]|uniref:MGMT family protein n=1 Tax=Paenibacillus gansuensis TaxID=306542 RepID=A0ABW5PCN1_9BACL
MTSFTETVISLIRGIPEGCVTTYGQIARSAGSPRAARQVVRILHSMSSRYQLPWHRVVSGNGEIKIRDEESFELQRFLLESEGVELNRDRFVDLDKYGYGPVD